MTHLPTLGACSALNHFSTSVRAHLDLSSPPATPRHLQAKSVTRAQVSSDGRLVFLRQGPSVEVIHAKTNERLAAWTFGGEDESSRAAAAKSPDSLSPTKAVADLEITCMCELVSASQQPQQPLLSQQDVPEIDDDPVTAAAAASPNTQTWHGPWRRFLACGLSNGLICLLDLKGSIIVRAIQVGSRITSIEAMATTNHRVLSEELLFFHGILAVGTQSGHVYLVDMALDWDSNVWEAADPISCERNTSTLCLLECERRHNDNIANMRQQRMRRRQHLAIDLNKEFYVRGAFQHKSTTSGDPTYFPEEGVSVCALSFVPHLASLAVGFNYGAWQLWNVSRLQLEFSSPYQDSEALPVVDFTFQEPENDPRNFCYLWTMQSETDFDTLWERFSVSSLATASLFALCYDSRVDDEQFGVLYTGLTTCRLRFEHRFSGADEEQPCGSLSLSCCTLGLLPSSPGGGGRGLLAADHPGALHDLSADPDTTAGNLGVAFFLWETHPARGQRPEYYFGLFDLNAWYQAQMPSHIDSTSLRQSSAWSNFAAQQCSYFSFCSLDDVFPSGKEATDVEENGEPLVHHLLAAGVDPCSVSRYDSLSNAEQHFFPSSLAFEVACVLNEGIVHVANLGLQRKVLLELQSQGMSALVEPQELFQLCLLSGLIDSSVISESASSFSLVPISQQRSLLLTVALENHLVSMLTGCVINWKDGKYSQAGCTLRFLLTWAWQKVTATKQLLDKATLPLFDHSCDQINDVTRRSLRQSSQQLRHLVTVIQALIRHAGVTEEQLASEDGMDELRTKYSVCRLIHKYLEVVLWFFNAGLLPEVREQANSEDSELSSNPYPVSMLVSMYRNKRQKMRRQLEKFASSFSAPLLLIDGLCQQLGDTLVTNFERDSGDGQYPPPSLHSLLSLYLIHREDKNRVDECDHTKHRIVQYLFLDVASYLSGDKWAALVDNLIKFPSAFSLPPSLIKLTQAFWLLDHEDFEEAMNLLLDPLIAAGDVEPWQHRAVMLALLAQGQAKLALKYARMRRPPQKEIMDVQLHIAILLANGMVLEAFQFQRQRGLGGIQGAGLNKETEKENLLEYFFSKAEELNRLDPVLQLSLTSAEEMALVKYLRRSPNQRSQELLLMYYLQRSRYQDARALNEQLEKDSVHQRKKSNQDLSGIRSTREAIMQRYSFAYLAQQPQQPQGGLAERLKLLKQGSDPHKPVPLSVEINTNRSFNPVFHSSAIHDELERRRHELSVAASSSTDIYTPFRHRSKRVKNVFSIESNVENDSISLLDNSSLGGSFLVDDSEASSNGGKRKIEFDESNDSIAFPKDVSTVKEEDLVQTPPPKKRSRLSVLPPLSAAGAQRLARFNQSKTAILSILDTPKIKKRPLDRRATIAGSSTGFGEIATPQSILKIKRLMTTQTPTQQDSTPQSTPSWLSHSNTPRTDVGNDANDGAAEKREKSQLTGILLSAARRESRSRESTPGKSLRFHVPKSYPPPDLIDEGPKGSSEDPVTEEELDREIEKSPEKSRRVSVDPKDVSAQESKDDSSVEDESPEVCSTDKALEREDAPEVPLQSPAIDDEETCEDVMHVEETSPVSAPTTPGETHTDEEVADQHEDDAQEIPKTPAHEESSFEKSELKPTGQPKAASPVRRSMGSTSETLPTTEESHLPSTPTPPRGPSKKRFSSEIGETAEKESKEDAENEDKTPDVDKEEEVDKGPQVQSPSPPLEEKPNTSLAKEVVSGEEVEMESSKVDDKEEKSSVSTAAVPKDVAAEELNEGQQSTTGEPDEDSHMESVAVKPTVQSKPSTISKEPSLRRSARNASSTPAGTTPLKRSTRSKTVSSTADSSPPQKSTATPASKAAKSTTDSSATKVRSVRSKRASSTTLPSTAESSPPKTPATSSKETPQTKSSLRKRSASESLASSVVMTSAFTPDGPCTRSMTTRASCKRAATESPPETATPAKAMTTPRSRSRRAKSLSIATPADTTTSPDEALSQSVTEVSPRRPRTRRTLSETEEEPPRSSRRTRRTTSESSVSSQTADDPPLTRSKARVTTKPKKKRFTTRMATLTEEDDDGWRPFNPVSISEEDKKLVAEYKEKKAEAAEAAAAAAASMSKRPKRGIKRFPIDP